MSKCETCIWRGDHHTGRAGRPGCSYIQHTGRSRLKEVYQRLGVDRITAAVREAMEPRNCTCYQKGAQRELAEKKIALPSGGASSAHKGKSGAPTRTPAPSGSGTRNVGGRPPKWDTAKGRELHRAGKNDHEIARALDISAATVCAWRKREGLPPNYQASPRGQQIKKLWESGAGDREIARELRIGLKKVQKWRQLHGLPHNLSQTERERQETQCRRLELYQKGLVDREIAEATGTTEKAIAAWRFRMNLPGNGLMRKGVLDQDTTARLYREGKTDGQIASELGVSKYTVQRWRKKRGNPPNLPQTRYSVQRTSWETEGLRLLEEGKSDREIAEAIGRSVSTVCSWRKRRKLPRNPDPAYRTGRRKKSG